MRSRRDERRCWWPLRATVAINVIATLGGLGCRSNDNPAKTPQVTAELRVGVAQLSSTNPVSGLRQLTQNLSVENLLRPAEDGRLEPQLADKWTLGADGRSVIVHLRQDVKFHDGSPLNAAAVVNLLPDALRTSMGPVFQDIESVAASGADSLEIRFRQPSPFLLEGLEAPIRKPGSAIIGTGPYMVAPNATTEMTANTAYYLEKPSINRITISNYPSVRSAWAEMLRDRLDMLYEVGTEALDSLEASTSISTFTYTRHYQYIVVLNSQSPNLHSRNARRALNFAVDRTAIVRDALNGHGRVSSQPVAPRHWALSNNTPAFLYDPKAATEALAREGSEKKTGSKLRFTCLVPPDAVNERIALQLKSQFASIGVDMTVEEASQEQIVEKLTKRDYDAVLMESISGPTLLRPYLFWHSDTPINRGGFGNQTIDSALENVRHAPSEDEYKRAVVGLQQAFSDDPPAIFLAWSVRARAVSKRFDVPSEEGRDILSTLRLWKPTTKTSHTSNN